MEQDLPPYRSNQEEMLSLLLSYPPGRIYGIAPKQVVLKGFDYYRNGSVLSFKWSAAPPALVARVRGAMIYSVTISADGNDLRFHCNCPAWTPHSNCKHAVGSMFTIKNLLEEGAFRTGIDNEEKGRRCSVSFTPNQTGGRLLQNRRIRLIIFLKSLNIR